MYTTSPKLKARSSGLLLHPTSFPGPYGIGDFGKAAYDWVDNLARTGQRWWQILPLGPTGYGDSPYQAFSAFAGNFLLVSPDRLVEEGLLKKNDIPAANFPDDRVDYGAVTAFKGALLALAWENFKGKKLNVLQARFERFVAENAHWLEDYALFMALSDAQGGGSWTSWPDDIRLRRAGALERARKKLADKVGLHRFRQFLFFRQWLDLKEYANNRGVQLIGDIPIFVSAESADVWANPQYFLLDGQRRPRVVAGVPPDYFCATGQLWGNPLYNWKALKEDGYAWWVARLRETLKQVDLIRLDHFRGFEAYWEIPAGMPTAEKGKWVKGPGADLLGTLRRELGGLPLIAEDLGLITPEVEALRDEFNLPGMRILQFAFGGAVEDRFLPHNYDRNAVVYTGTHDNDTTRGWFNTLTARERAFVLRYLGRDGSDVTWDLIRLAWGSVADRALVPFQDILDLGSEGRMNMPGRPWGNWGWRYTSQMGSPAMWDRLADLTDLYGRKNEPAPVALEEPEKVPVVEDIPKEKVPAVTR